MAFVFLSTTNFHVRFLVMSLQNSRQARWLEDHESETCMNPNCQMLFNMVSRRHHCRRCGLLYCDACTSTRVLIPRDYLVSKPSLSSTAKASLELESANPHRVCNICSISLSECQEDLRKVLSKANHETFIERDGNDRYLNPPVSYSLDNEIRKATYSLLNLTKDNSMEGVADKIPYHILLNARGLVFMTVLKVGFMLTGRVGTGLVMSKMPDGSWSAPCAIGVSGVGWGFQVGTELSDVILILNTQNAVDAFTSESQIAIGSQLGVSVGPIGRSAGTDLHIGKEGASAAFSYAHSKGLFMGISLEASGIFCRPDVNRCFYGHDVKPSTLLSSAYPKPLGAEPLYRALSEVLAEAKRSTGYDEVCVGGSAIERIHPNANASPALGPSYLRSTAMNTAVGGEFGLSTSGNKKPVYNSANKEMSVFTPSKTSYGNGDLEDDYVEDDTVHNRDNKERDGNRNKDNNDNGNDNGDDHPPPPVHEVVVDNNNSDNKDDHSFISDLTTSEGAASSSAASDGKSFDTVIL